MSTSKSVYLLVVVAAMGTAFGVPLSASHSWGDYHWARKTSSFALTVINSTTEDWDPYVADAAADWSQSQKLDMVQDPNGATGTTDRRQCKTVTGKVHVCNMTYGFNQWLGVAGISIDPNGHITTGYVKVNDSYFSPDAYGGYYATPLWKQSVMCQELGHTIGLDHQDEDFNNTSLVTCMDYQDPPTASPNAHDYEQLELIYGHTDSYNSYDAGSGGGGGSGCSAPPGKGCNKAGIAHGNNASEWGLSLGRRGRTETFLQIEPDGTRHYTFVTWVDR